MNELQETVLKVIIAIFSIDDIHENFDRDGPWKGQKKIRHATIRYGLLNYVAKFSLASERYFVTEKSKRHLISNNFLKNGVLRRGDRGKHGGFTHEHPVPSNMIADLLYEHRKDNCKMREILMKTNQVTVLTYEENDLLTANGFTKSMPPGWNIEDGDIFARYVESGVEVPTEKISVTGAIAR
ncbi:MAG TPA: hypothetical protein DCM54_15995 [Gammaproteobacteria bacterium]|nr:hypothetical protein [Gammaproteobacteria bacterium]